MLAAMRRLLMTALVLFAFPALAGNTRSHTLWGTWKISIAEDRSFSGTLLVDRQGRAYWRGDWDPEYRRKNRLTPAEPGQARSIGFIRLLKEDEYEIVLTNKAVVSNVHCVTQSRELLRCSKGATLLTLIGPGPESLMPAGQ